MTGDVHDPRTWFRGFVEAVHGVQHGDKGPATAYLKLVEKHRGRDVAESTRANIITYAKHPKWQQARKLLPSA